MKSNFRFVIFAAFTLLSASSLLYAQGGCTDSPEAPTDILMFVGTVGMFYGSYLLRKVIGRRGNR
jgi:XrtJ-associated TM-motif-TM protein